MMEFQRIVRKLRERRVKQWWWQARVQVAARPVAALGLVLGVGLTAGTLLGAGAGWAGARQLGDAGHAGNAEVERILPMMTSMLPVSGLQTLLLAVEVDALSERLDAAMVRALGRKLDGDIDDASYARAYRKVGERTARLDQIRLIGETGAALDALARKPLLRGLLKMMHGPAQMAGLGELHAFLFRGFEAFRSLADAEAFLDTIVSREGALALVIFDGSDTLASTG